MTIASAVKRSVATSVKPKTKAGDCMSQERTFAKNILSDLPLIAQDRFSREKAPSQKLTTHN